MPSPTTTPWPEPSVRPSTEDVSSRFHPSSRFYASFGFYASSTRRLVYTHPHAPPHIPYIFTCQHGSPSQQAYALTHRSSTPTHVLTFLHISVAVAGTHNTLEADERVAPHFGLFASGGASVTTSLNEAFASPSYPSNCTAAAAALTLERVARATAYWETNN